MGMLMPIIPQRVAPGYILPPGCLDFKAKYHVNPWNSAKEAYFKLVDAAQGQIQDFS